MNFLSFYRRAPKFPENFNLADHAGARASFKLEKSRVASRFLKDVPDERVASKGTAGVRPQPFRFAANPYLMYLLSAC